MTVMKNTERYASGAPIINKPVRIYLWSSPSYASEASYEAVYEVVTDDEGEWTADLEPTDNLVPANNVYIAEVRFRGGQVRHLFTVPTVGTELWIGDYLTDAPATLESPALSLHAANMELHGGGNFLPQPLGDPVVGQTVVVASVGPLVLAWAEVGSPTETFAMLTEDGNTMITEAGDIMIAEAA